MVWSVPPGLLDDGGKPQPAYLNFRTALLSPPVGDDAQVTFILPPQTPAIYLALAPVAIGSLS